MMSSKSSTIPNVMCVALIDKPAAACPKCCSSVVEDASGVSMAAVISMVATVEKSCGGHVVLGCEESEVMSPRLYAKWTQEQVRLLSWWLLPLAKLVNPRRHHHPDR